MSGRITAVFPRATQTGGVERVTWRLLDHLRASGGFVGTELDPPLAGTSWRRVPSKPVPTWWEPARFRRAAAPPVDTARRDGDLLVSMGVECPPGDVYWVHSVHRAFLGDSGPITLRGRRMPTGLRRLMPVHRVLLSLEHAYFTRYRPRLVLATSHREAEDLHRLYGVSLDLVTVVPNGVDLAEFSPERRLAARPAARAGVGVGEDEISLLFPANELYRKGFPALVEALALTGDSRLRVDVVGSVAPREVYALARRHGVASRVHVHGRSRRISEWHAVADAIVLPTWYEPFGIVLIEGLASGLPVITTTRAGAADAVRRAGGSLLDDPGDTAALADALAELLDSTHRARLATLGPVAAASYSWPVVLDRVVGLVRSAA